MSIVFDGHPPTAPRPPHPPARWTIANPRRKLVLSCLLIGLATATVVTWPREAPPPVAVVESGFHLAPGADEDDAAWAVVVENTGNDTAENAMLRFTYRDDEGTSDDSQTFGLPELAPGERQVATGTHSERALQDGYIGSSDGLSGPPVDMTVEVEASYRSTDRAQPEEIAVSDVWTGWGLDPLDREILAVAVDPADDVPPFPNPVQIVLVFRDSENRTIGGRLLIAQPDIGRTASADRPRPLFTTLRAEAVPDNLASIEVHLREDPS